MRFFNTCSISSTFALELDPRRPPPSWRSSSGFTSSPSFPLHPSSNLHSPLLKKSLSSHGCTVSPPPLHLPWTQRPHSAMRSSLLLTGLSVLRSRKLWSLSGHGKHTKQEPDLHVIFEKGEIRWTSSNVRTVFIEWLSRWTWYITHPIPHTPPPP